MPSTGSATTQSPTPAKTARSGSSSRKHEGESNPDANVSGIGNYIFEKTIGQGNFAKVKLSKHKLTGQEVAVKIIDKTTLDEKKLSKLHREVRIMKMLNHPNIVKLFEVIETKHTLFLVMEYVSGGELYDYLVAHGRMKEKDARAKFRQILSAVNYCHRKRVIHRDLKAENLLMDENLNIKIADFGFSNHYVPDGQLDTFCGSPPYAAPELFQGRKYTGPEVDIWSLGVILYVLCTGCLPFDGKDLKEMREVVCRGRYKVPFYLSDTCEKLLRKFLVRDPTKRASLDMLIDDPWINEGYDDSPITADIAPDVAQQVDEEIIRYMTDKYNVPRDHVLNCLEENTYDDVAAIYMLLSDQKSTGKWVPYQGSVLGPMSPIALQAGTSNPVSKATPMGTIGEEGDAVHQFEPGNRSSVVEAQSSERRDRSQTMGNARQRPVTWMANETQAQKLAAELSKPYDGSGPKLENAQLGTENSTALRQPVSGHARHATMPAPFSPANGSGATDMEDVKQESANQANGNKQKTGVIGAIRSLGRRLSESTANASAAAAAVISQTPVGDGDERPRSLRFTFNSNTTSSKQPDEIVREILNACQKNNIKYQPAGRFLIECTWFFREAPIRNDRPGGGNMDTEQLQRALQEVMNGSAANLAKTGTEKDWKDICRFDIEVCELPRLKNLHALRFKRIGGPSTEYKEICGKILECLNL